MSINKELFIEDLKSKYTLLQEVNYLVKNVIKLIDELNSADSIKNEIAPYINELKQYVTQNGNTTEITGNLSVDGNLVMNGSDVVTKSIESVIDLGTISSSFQSSVCEDLDGLTETGIYTFKYDNTRYMMNVEKVQSGATTYSTFQYIYIKPDVYFTRINNGTSWSYFGAKYLVDSADSVTSGNISNKIFLVGRTSQSITGGTAYSHDTVYVDTDGHLYDSGNRVLTTADNVGGVTKLYTHLIKIENGDNNETYTFIVDSTHDKIITSLKEFRNSILKYVSGSSKYGYVINGLCVKNNVNHVCIAYPSESAYVKLNIQPVDNTDSFTYVDLNINSNLTFTSSVVPLF